VSPDHRIPPTPSPPGGLQIELLVVSDCPNRLSALDRLRAALDTLGGPPVTVTERTIDDPADAQAAGMHGSPTIRVNGQDPFAGPDAMPSVSCRLYPSNHGLDGAPSVDKFVAALSAALDSIDD
jgi:hypothetical protein